jgi:hypothetical protein
MKAMMMLGLAVLVGIVAYGFLASSFAPRSVYAATLDSIMTRLQADPEIRAGLEARLRQACSAPVLPQVFCRDAHSRVAFELAQKGAGRLDREAATRRVLLLSSFLVTLDEPACGALGRRDAGGTAGFRAAFERLPVERLRDWEDLAVAAVTAELRGTPAEPLDEQEVAAAQTEFARGLDAQARGRLTAMRIVKNDDRGLSDHEVCWVGRTVYGRIAEMPEPYRSVMAVYLARE